MLVDNFYKIENIESDKNKAIIKIKLNQDHEIYKGHFPDQPMVPGVMQVQMIKEILSKLVNKKLQLKSAGNIKYLSFMLPDEATSYEAEIFYSKNENSEYVVKANIKSSDKVFLKLNGLYVIDE